VVAAVVTSCSLALAVKVDSHVDLAVDLAQRLIFVEVRDEMAVQALQSVGVVSPVDLSGRKLQIYLVNFYKFQETNLLRLLISIGRRLGIIRRFFHSSFLNLLEVSSQGVTTRCLNYRRWFTSHLRFLFLILTARIMIIFAFLFLLTLLASKI
jgi:hypothetical protein